MTPNGSSSEMTPISSLSDAALMIELANLATRAGPDERRALAFLCTSKAPAAISGLEIVDLYAAAPVEERRIQLAFARRIVALGMNAYGPLDLARDKRNLIGAAVEEDLDGVTYRVYDLLRGKDPGRFLGDGLDLARRSVVAAVRMGAF